MPVRDDQVPDDRRRALLMAALGFVRLEPLARPLVLLHRWLDTWAGLGDIEWAWSAKTSTSSSRSTTRGRVVRRGL